MSLIRWSIDISQPQQRLQGIAKAAASPLPILKRWGGYLRHKGLQRADAADGWPALAESTRRRYEQTRTSQVTVQGKIRGSYGRKLEGYLRVQERKGEPGAAADLAELRRLRAGGRVEREPGKRRAAAWGGSKAVDRLRKKLARAEDQRAKGQRARAGGDRRKAAGKLLGRVPRQLVFEVQAPQVLAMARAPWSGAHNEGATVGHGAQLPPRPFLYVEREDTAELSKIALQQMLGLGGR